MTDEFPGNSKKAKKKAAAPAPEKDIQKVISGVVVRRKTPLGTRFKELFLTGDDSRSVFEYMMTEHIRPGFKDLVFDAFTGGMERKFYPDGHSSYGRRRSSPAVSNGLGMLTNYAAASRGPAGGAVAETRMSRSARRNHDFGEFVFPTKPEAELTLETMYEIIGRHDEVSVADFMQMVGETPEFTAETWGWTSLEGSRVRRAPGGGYVIDLPRTESLA